jgi:regulatory protein
MAQDSGRESKAYNSAIRMLGLREHSEAELAGKLRRKFSKLPPSAIEEIVDRLKGSDLLSDARFTEIMIRSRTSRGYGPYYIRRELASKGVAAELAEQQLGLVETDWQRLATELVARRHRNVAEDAKAWAKAVRFLQRRGFGGELVAKAVGKQPHISARHTDRLNL